MEKKNTDKQQILLVQSRVPRTYPFIHFEVQQVLSKRWGEHKIRTHHPFQSSQWISLVVQRMILEDHCLIVSGNVTIEEFIKFVLTVCKFSDFFHVETLHIIDSISQNFLNKKAVFKKEMRQLQDLLFDYFFKFAPPTYLFNVDVAWNLFELPLT